MALCRAFVFSCSLRIILLQTDFPWVLVSFILETWKFRLFRHHELLDCLFCESLVDFGNFFATFYFPISGGHITLTPHWWIRQICTHSDKYVRLVELTLEKLAGDTLEQTSGIGCFCTVISSASGPCTPCFKGDATNTNPPHPLEEL